MHYWTLTAQALLKAFLMHAANSYSDPATADPLLQVNFGARVPGVRGWEMRERWTERGACIQDP